MALPCLPETKYTNRQRQELQVKVLINVLVHVTEHFIHTVAGVFRAILPFLTGPLSRPNTPTSDATLPPVSMSVSAPSSSSSATPSASPASPLPPSGGVGPKQTVDLASREDKDIVHKIIKGEINHYNLERQLNDCTRAVNIRRRVFEHTLGRSLAGLPYEHYDYGKVLGQCCELVIGHIPLPVGVVGPLVLDGTSYFVPMATVEGCLVASANRGCKAIGASGGGSTIVIRDGMSRGPVVRMPSCVRAGQLKCWLDQVENVERIAEAFNGTTRFGRLECIKSTVAGRNVYLRFTAFSGDAMGMNMVSKGVNKALEVLQRLFTDMEIVSISGNYCTDKKPAAMNWLEGRGKSVVAEAIVLGDIVRTVLKTSVDAMVDCNIQKNLVGSAMAGALGGYNAHASNLVSAVFLATGQDIAQNVESSNCITLMERINEGKDLYISVTMPSIEVGTVGGGTHLPAQMTCLEMLGVRGPCTSRPGAHAQQLARIVAGLVLAGELSLMAALAAGHLVKSHMQYNRQVKEKPSIPGPVCFSSQSTNEHCSS
eukprot:TRINITY_DN1247_c0_g1_i2.p1 TRINITY_DN1247_c0_g1~~TRINITY_DN1247_c0_g1_i2.p1  ORF type:complete len:574 (-),score=111.08 TRINITY_DN1247_c0_g1_i2:129-1751(-)